MTVAPSSPVPVAQLGAASAKPRRSDDSGLFASSMSDAMQVGRTDQPGASADERGSGRQNLPAAKPKAADRGKPERRSSSADTDRPAGDPVNNPAKNTTKLRTGPANKSKTAGANAPVAAGQPDGGDPAVEGNPVEKVTKVANELLYLLGLPLLQLETPAADAANAPSGAASAASNEVGVPVQNVGISVTVSDEAGASVQTLGLSVKATGDEHADPATGPAEGAGSSGVSLTFTLIKGQGGKAGDPTIADLLALVGNVTQEGSGTDKDAKALSGAELISSLAKLVVRHSGTAGTGEILQPKPNAISLPVAQQPAIAIPGSTDVSTPNVGDAGQLPVTAVAIATSGPVPGKTTPVADPPIDPALVGIALGGAGAISHTGSLLQIGHGDGVSAHQLVQQIAEQLNAKFTGNASEFSMTLKPESLGSIDVQIRVDGDKVHIRLAADGQTRDLIQAGIVDLRSSLGSFSGRDVNVELVARQSPGLFSGGGFSENRQFDSRSTPGRGRGGQRQPVGAIATDGDNPASSDPSALVDYRI